MNEPEWDFKDPEIPEGLEGKEDEAWWDAHAYLLDPAFEADRKACEAETRRLMRLSLRRPRRSGEFPNQPGGFWAEFSWLAEPRDGQGLVEEYMIPMFWGIIPRSDGTPTPPTTARDGISHMLVAGAQSLVRQGLRLAFP